MTAAAADLKALLAEVGVLVEAASVCGESVSASGAELGQDFNQLMIFLMDAGRLCAHGQLFQKENGGPDVVFPRFPYPQPRVIYPRREVAREAMGGGAEGLHEVILDGAGRATIVPFGSRTKEA